MLFWSAEWRPEMVRDCTLPSPNRVLPDFEWKSEVQDHQGLPFQAAPASNVAVADEGAVPAVVEPKA